MKKLKLQYIEKLFIYFASKAIQMQNKIKQKFN